MILPACSLLLLCPACSVTVYSLSLVSDSVSRENEISRGRSTVCDACLAQESGHAHVAPQISHARRLLSHQYTTVGATRPTYYTLVTHSDHILMSNGASRRAHHAFHAQHGRRRHQAKSHAVAALCARPGTTGYHAQRQTLQTSTSRHPHTVCTRLPSSIMCLLTRTLRATTFARIGCCPRHRSRMGALPCRRTPCMQDAPHGLACHSSPRSWLRHMACNTAHAGQPRASSLGPFSLSMCSGGCCECLCMLGGCLQRGAFMPACSMLRHHAHQTHACDARRRRHTRTHAQYVKTWLAQAPVYVPAHAGWSPPSPPPPPPPHRLPRFSPRSSPLAPHLSLRSSRTAPLAPPPPLLLPSMLA